MRKTSITITNPSNGKVKEFIVPELAVSVAMGWILGASIVGSIEIVKSYKHLLFDRKGEKK